MKIIDSHQHFWQIGRFNYEWMSPDDKILCKDFLPADFEQILRRSGIAKSVVVQAHQSTAETLWLLDLADEHEFIAGIVGWVDLQNPDVENNLQELAMRPKFRGVRHLVQDERQDDWLTEPEVLRGLNALSKYDLTYDLLVFTRHLPYAQTVVENLPHQRFVIDHLAKPPIATGEIAEWKSALKKIAVLPNVYCKLSGLITEANYESWTVKDLRPYVETALDLFGEKRLMFGSDYPVCLLAASYEKVLETYQSFLINLSETDQNLVLSQNAIDFYKL